MVFEAGSISDSIAGGIGDVLMGLANRRLSQQERKAAENAQKKAQEEQAAQARNQETIRRAEERNLLASQGIDPNSPQGRLILFGGNPELKQAIEKTQQQQKEENQYQQFLAANPNFGSQFGGAPIPEMLKKAAMQQYLQQQTAEQERQQQLQNIANASGLLNTLRSDPNASLDTQAYQTLLPLLGNPSQIPTFLQNYLHLNTDVQTQADEIERQRLRNQATQAQIANTQSIMNRRAATPIKGGKSGGSGGGKRSGSGGKNNSSTPSSTPSSMPNADQERKNIEAMLGRLDKSYDKLRKT